MLPADFALSQPCVCGEGVDCVVCVGRREGVACVWSGMRGATDTERVQYTV